MIMSKMAANLNGYMNNDQALAYCRYAAAKLVEKGVISQDQAKRIYLAMYYTFDDLTLEEVEERAWIQYNKSMSQIE